MDKAVPAIAIVVGGVIIIVAIPAILFWLLGIMIVMIVLGILFGGGG